MIYFPAQHSIAMIMNTYLQAARQCRLLINKILKTKRKKYVTVRPDNYLSLPHVTCQLIALKFLCKCNAFKSINVLCFMSAPVYFKYVFNKIFTIRFSPAQHSLKFKPDVSVTEFYSQEDGNIIHAPQVRSYVIKSSPCARGVEFASTGVAHQCANVNLPYAIFENLEYRNTRNHESIITDCMSILMVILLPDQSNLIIFFFIFFSGDAQTIKTFFIKRYNKHVHKI